MTDPGEIEARLAAVEAKVDIAAADALAARHLAAAGDRDLADLGVKVDANRKAINALGEQTAARFERLETEMRDGFVQLRDRIDGLETEMRDGFAGMRGRLDQTAAGQQRIVDLLTTMIDPPDGR